LVENKRKGEFGCHDVVNGLAVVFRFEGSVASDHFVDHDASGPNINLLSVASTHKHLGSSVVKGSSDGEHFKFGVSSAMFPANAIVYQFQLFADRVVKDVFGLDVSVTDCTLMEIEKGLKQLLNDLSELVLGFDDNPSQVGSIKEFHHQPAGVFLDIQVKGFIFDDVAVIETFHEHKVAQNLRDMLIIEHERFDSVLHATAFLQAAVDHTISTLTQLAYHFILFSKDLGMLVRNLSFFTLKADPVA